MAKSTALLRNDTEGSKKEVGPLSEKSRRCDLFGQIRRHLASLVQPTPGIESCTARPDLAATSAKAYCHLNACTNVKVWPPETAVKGKGLHWS